jgi:hypothetical protein
MKRLTRPQLFDHLATVWRKPTAEPLITPAEVISAALSMFVPGPASVISPTGLGPSLILLALKKMGFKIVAMEREDYEENSDRFRA